MLPSEVQRAYLEAVVPCVKAGRVSGVRVSTRPDGLGRAQVKLLRGFPVATVEIGCQSFCDHVLRRAGRNTRAAEVAPAVGMLREAGIAVGLQLMPGLPGAGPGEAVESLVYALALEPDFLRIYPTLVLRGTGLEKAYRQGTYRPLDLGRAVEVCAEMFWRCHRAGVPVIRLGLQATAELDWQGALVAGPYHPAFGQLVRSHLWLRALRRVGSCTAEVGVHPSELSDALGQRRCNQQALQEEFGDYLIQPKAGVTRHNLDFSGRQVSLWELAAYEGSDSID